MDSWFVSPQGTGLSVRPHAVHNTSTGDPHSSVTAPGTKGKESVQSKSKTAVQTFIL